MPSVFEMALAFNWRIPATLLYAFSEIAPEGKLKPMYIEGKTLAQGQFLIDQFASSGDSFNFQLYEWTAGENPAELHSGPRLFQIHVENFELEDLFTSQPTFRRDQFLGTAQKVTAEESPFPGLPHLYKWLRSPFAQQHFPIVELEEQQVFRILAKAVVASRSDRSGDRRQVRTFLFDPEMTVGDDGSGPTPQASVKAS